jgi:hypothetical protein
MCDVVIGVDISVEEHLANVYSHLSCEKRHAIGICIHPCDRNNSDS